MFLIKKIGWLILECILFAAIFTACLAAQYFIAKGLGFHLDLWNVDSLNESTNPFSLMGSFLPVFIAFTVAAILAYYLIMKHPFLDLGFNGKDSLVLFGKGLLLSVGLIVPGFVILWHTGQIKILPIDFNPVYILGFFIFFFIQSTAEEVFTRSYLIPTIELRLGTAIAVIISASLFAVLHIGNDNFTWIGFFNILIGGFIMAYLFVYFRNLWICAGFHTGWNFLQGSFFDFNVSGVDVYSFIQFQDTGYSNISGSSFGYEGSLLAILLQLIALYFIYKTYKIGYKPLETKAPLETISEHTLDLSNEENSESISN